MEKMQPEVRSLQTLLEECLALKQEIQETLELIVDLLS